MGLHAGHEGREVFFFALLQDAVSDGGRLLARPHPVHYQFETIHPFVDGNGRVGRLLIALFLLEKKALTTPALPVSYYLRKPCGIL